MIYTYFCPKCKETIELVMPMSEAGSEERCEVCDSVLVRDFGDIRFGKGHKQYRRQIVSDSLAVSIDQIEEHKKKFPNIQITPEGQPVFDNYADHDAYLEACNAVKIPGKSRKVGNKYRRNTEARAQGLASTQDRWLKKIYSSPTSRVVMAGTD